MPPVTDPAEHGAEHPPKNRRNGDPASGAKGTVQRKAFTALLALVFAVASVTLPPIANRQLVDAEKLIRKPALAFVVAVTIVALSAWRARVAVGVAAAALLACIVQITYYVATTAPGRDAASAASGWKLVPLASGAAGAAENHPDVFGSARINWSGSSLRLDLRSNTGATQQGFYLNGGSLGSRFYFEARVDKVDGGQVVTCPLLFGVQNRGSYFTFRIHTAPDGDTIAEVYQIIPNSPELTSGFHGILLDNTPSLPYVNTWNWLTPSDLHTTTLAIAVNGSYYGFFVDEWQVFAREVDDVPTHTVAVGVTVLANGLRSDAVCQTSDVELRVDPQQP
jgi:hypothetical protein